MSFLAVKLPKKLDKKFLRWKKSKKGKEYIPEKFSNVIHGNLDQFTFFICHLLLNLIQETQR